MKILLAAIFTINFKFWKNTTNINEHLKLRHLAYFQSTFTARFENEKFMKPKDYVPPTSISSNDNIVNANVTGSPTKLPKQL